MRRILIEQARRKGRQKRGGDRNRVELAQADVASSEPQEDLLALHEALSQFEQESPKKAELVKLRYFAGLTVGLAAEALGISTADNYWAYARSWLRQIQSDEARLEYLNQVSGDDTARRDRILRLLDGDKPDSFLEKPILATEVARDAPDQNPSRGDCLDGDCQDTRHLALPRFRSGWEASC